jgi:O-antigen ligase
MSSRTAAWTHVSDAGQDLRSLSVLADIKILPIGSLRLEPRRMWSVIVALWIWCALLSFPLLSIDAIEMDTTNNKALVYQTAGLLLFVVVILTAMPARAALSIFRYSPFQLTIVLVILLSLPLQFYGPEFAILSGIAYTVTLLVVIACLSTLWTLPQEALAICFGGMSLIFAAFGLSAIAAFGWPHDRVLGTIHPNAFGSVMLAGFVLSLFSGRPAMLAVRIICLVLAAAVSSRFAVIGCLLAYLVFELSLRPFSAKLAVAALATLALLLLFPNALMNLLALDDPSRNLDSGFTGRNDLWNRALEAIAEAPFGLGFKRSLYENSGHNGYLKWLVEFGVLGGGLIIASAISVITVALVDPWLAATTDYRRLAAARAGGLVAVMFASFFQPQLFNLGDIHGLSVMLMLFSPQLLPERRLPF